MNNNTIIIPAKIIRGAMLCQADSRDVREYLNGIALNGDTGEVIGTDGHILYVNTVSELEGVFKGIRILQIPQKIPASIRKIALDYQANKIYLLKEIIDDKGNMATEPTGVVLDCRVLDDDYPDYHQVVPSADKQLFANPFTLNPKLVARATKAIEVDAREGQSWFVYENYVVLSDGFGAKVIVMKMEWEDDE